ncbi:PTS sugar transporter subunit IIC [Secundilactobacillus oryzae]|uniref:PTS sugar transporter subunit IIC n=1 Tax=Secundilactobacillus oryzae TaxID=1202668 RepID=UPI000A604F86|nr:PTS sugar transporter subunit IIC [Secundilactobacillus oryzae]
MDKTETSTLTAHNVIMNVLNGLSLGTVVALVPAAILGNLMLAVKGIFPFAANIITLTNLSMVLLASVSALVTALLFKMTPIQSASLAIVAELGSGNWHLVNGAFMVKGTGDVVNIILTMILGVVFLKLVGNKLKAYNVLLLPTLMILIVGVISILTLPYVSSITTALGELIAMVTTMQPILMGVVMAIIFAVLIVTPISVVAIALTISLGGIAAGSANLGIVAGSFVLAFMGYGANSFGTSITHFLGSPKIQMANMLAKPKLFIPVIVSSGLLGGLGAALGVTGTPMSAGFGFSGLVGPLAAYNGGMNGTMGIITIVILFFALPIVLGYLARLSFVKKMPTSLMRLIYG